MSAVSAAEVGAPTACGGHARVTLGAERHATVTLDAERHASVTLESDKTRSGVR
jgi:hypothetical protein